MYLWLGKSLQASNDSVPSQKDDEDYYYYGEGSGYDDPAVAAATSDDAASNFGPVYYARIVLTLRRPWSEELVNLQGAAKYSCNKVQGDRAEW